MPMSSSALTPPIPTGAGFGTRTPATRWRYDSARASTTRSTQPEERRSPNAPNAPSPKSPSRPNRNEPLARQPPRKDPPLRGRAVQRPVRFNNRPEINLECVADHLMQRPLDPDAP